MRGDRDGAVAPVTFSAGAAIGLDLRDDIIGITAVVGAIRRAGTFTLAAYGAPSGVLMSPSLHQAE